MSDLLRVITSVICDDIRRESNGKLILIGVYGSGIKVASLPSFVVMSLLLEVQPTVVGDHELRVRLTGQSNAVLFESPPVKFSIDAIKFVNVPMVGLPIQIQSPGPIELQISVAGTEWQTIRTLTVEVGPLPLVPTFLTPI